LVYGDMTENSTFGAWVAPCINQATFVYCFAGWAVTASQTPSVFIDNLAVTNFTFNAAHNFESQGIIATLTFDELRTDMLNYLTQYYSYPIWFVRELMTYYPEPVVEKFLRNGNDPQPLQMRLVDDAELIKQYLANLQKLNIRFKQGKFLKNFIHIISDSNPTHLPGFESGKFIFQNEASGLVVDLLNPLPNDTVLDLCAAPGGKTTDIAARVGSANKVTAVDISELRLNILRDNLKRLSIDNVLTVIGDGIRFASGEYNKILVDAPCSGTGVFRKYPEGRWITTPEDVGRFAVMQYSLVNSAARLLSPGGPASSARRCTRSNTGCRSEAFSIRRLSWRP
jgi:16S rRNA (cytosine967-C5)-methyltransferase